MRVKRFLEEELAKKRYNEPMDYLAKYLSANDKIDINSSDLYYFVNYYQWNKVKDLPKTDRKYLNTTRILNFKKGYKDCYGYFAKCFISHIKDFGNEEWILCSVPGHAQTSASPNHMDNFFKYLYLPNNMHPTIGLIIRGKVMLEKHGANYGKRTVQKDIDSFKIGNARNIQGQNIIIFDDITTSGCSLVASRQFLMDRGAKKVVCIALGKTVEDYDYYEDFLF